MIHVWYVSGVVQLATKRCYNKFQSQRQQLGVRSGLQSPNGSLWRRWELAGNICKGAERMMAPKPIYVHVLVSCHDNRFQLKRFFFYFLSHQIHFWTHAMASLSFIVYFGNTGDLWYISIAYWRMHLIGYPFSRHWVLCFSLLSGLRCSRSFGAHFFSLLFSLTSSLLWVFPWVSPNACYWMVILSGLCSP